MPPIELTNSAKIALAISAAFPLGAGAAPAGRIDFAVGNVTAKLADGSSRPLAKGAEINAGETIDTGEGRAQLRYTDGSQVSLRPGTQYRIDDYKFSGKNDGQEKAFFSLLKGGFRTITGLIGKGNREAYKVTTPTATIGIRGTEFAVLSDQNGVTISTGDGLVQVCNAGGCIVLASGESAVVADKDGRPVRVINKGPDSTSDKPSTPSVVVEKPKEDSVIAASLPSGPGYAMGIVGMATYDGGETTAPFTAKHSPVDATFSDGKDLTTASYGGDAYSSSSVSGFTDGMIGWGRWTSVSDPANLAGISSYGGITLSSVHYIIGQPTTAADMAALHANNVTGTYALVGYTVPTSEYGAVHSGTITGALTAFFGEGSNVEWSLNGLNFGAGNFSGSVSGNVDITGSTFSGSTSCGSGCSVQTEGLFVGANAARAGLVYKLDPGIGSQGTIMGAAAFKK